MNTTELPSGPVERIVGRHTPGPWHVAESGFSRRGLWSAPTVYATDDELRYVAVCACADELNFHRATDNLANARLIAAAPDLLDALVQWQSADRDNDPRERMNARRSRDAAIAKARGVPPNSTIKD